MDNFKAYSSNGYSIFNIFNKPSDHFTCSLRYVTGQHISPVKPHKLFQQKLEHEAWFDHRKMTIRSNVRDRINESVH